MSVDSRFDTLRKKIDAWRVTKTYHAQKLPEKYVIEVLKLYRDFPEINIAPRVGITKKQLKRYISNAHGENSPSEDKKSMSSKNFVEDETSHLIRMQFHYRDEFRFECACSRSSAVPILAELISKLRGGIDLV